MNFTIISDLKTLRFWRHTSIRALAFGGGISAAIQFIIIIFPEAAESFKGGWPLLVIVIFSFIAGIIASWPRPIEMEFSTPKTKIKIIKGDILDQTNHLVIGVCNTFDTETPNIIANNSLLGQTLNKLFNGDLNDLNLKLDQALSGKNSIGQINKLGKTEIYEIGTVAVVNHQPRKIFFMAYCEMNNQNVASGEIDHVWKSLMSLWDAVTVNGNHGSISIPVIGGGLSRISNILPAQDSIRLIALSYMFASRKSKVCDELCIIVHPTQYNSLDRMELQSFLSSLRPS